MNRVNPILNTNLWDNARALANGLVANGHVVLLILVCFGIFFMSRGMLGLADLIDQPESTEQSQLIENIIAIDEQIVEGWKTFQRASDERINMHYQCASAAFRSANEEMCAALERHVANSFRR